MHTLTPVLAPGPCEEGHLPRKCCDVPRAVEETNLLSQTGFLSVLHRCVCSSVDTKVNDRSSTGTHRLHSCGGGAPAPCFPEKTKGVPYLFTSLLVIRVSLEKCLSRLFAHFKIRVSVSVAELRGLRATWELGCHQTCSAVSSFGGCPFIFSRVSLEAQNSF